MKEQIGSVQESVLKIRLILCILVVLTNALLQPTLASQPDIWNCGVDETVPAACRVLVNGGGADGPVVVTALVYYLNTIDQKADYYHQVSTVNWTFESGSRLTEVDLDFQFGTVQTVFEGLYAPDQQAAAVSFWKGDIVGLWFVRGKNFDALSYLKDLWLQTGRTISEDLSATVLSYLPDLEDMPDGFSVFTDKYSVSFSELTNQTTPPGDLTDQQLQATISALEAQVATLEAEHSPTPLPSPTATSAPTPTATVRPSPTPSTVISGPLEIIDVNSRDAGLGNGTYYVYVEVRNITSKSLFYVVVDITCRNSSGSVVTTGMANSLNLAPGASVVLTGILMGASSCTMVEVSTNPLTGAF